MSNIIRSGTDPVSEPQFSIVGIDGTIALQMIKAYGGLYLWFTLPL